ncbi:heterokaryon incompatibility protein-domain-containing protein [Phascolomyces articulosus]|uniref:Heterokaryon incompatibility protein-domain-containing protein n=1 Tax=Phascolomyces articulosus TaxID=60185 RepID=A0AAD5JM80_9FUNG|nr:heterokaryon incompatibility protein-domain-containing protein [Phascolomyces articulosus]
MYITYDTRQLSDYRECALIGGSGTDDDAHIKNQYHVHPPKRFPDQIPKSDYKPNKLVRVSDMQVISGSKVKEGYCALSYVWEQSGDIIPFDDNNNNDHGNYKRVDRGKHKLIQWNKTAKGGGGKKNSNNNTTVGSKKSMYSSKPKNVRFEDIVQKVCKDFNIRYIWYDQLCIDHQQDVGDNLEKMREIKSMHQIYKHAFGTVVLVPEFRVDDSKILRRTTTGGGAPSHLLDETLSITTKSILSESKWFKRLWTFQEALMSQNIVFVGENIHSWWYKAYAYKDMYFICNTPQQWNVSTILWYTHIRTCSNPYDRIFILANLFPDMMDTITMDYNQSFDPLLIQCYGALAKKDLSILCFGQHLEYKVIGQQRKRSSIEKNGHSSSDDENDYDVPIQQYEDILPSWTGIDGEHLQGDFTTNFQNYSIVDTSMQVTCTFITSVDDPAAITSVPFKPLTFDDLPPFQFLDQKNKSSSNNNDILSSSSLKRQELAIKIQLPESDRNSHGPKKTFIVTLSLFSSDIFSLENPKPSSLHGVSKTLCILSSIIPITNDDLFWYDCCNDDNSSNDNETTTQQQQQCINFDFNLTEETDNYSQYVILSGISFINNDPRSSYSSPPYKIFPVIKEEGDHYKAIGTCKIVNPDHLFSGCTLPEETFNIQ